MERKNQKSGEYTRNTEAEKRSHPARVTTFVTDPAESAEKFVGRIEIALRRMIPQAAKEGQKIALYYPKLYPDDAIAERTAELVQTGLAFSEAEIQAYYDMRLSRGKGSYAESISTLQKKEISAYISSTRKEPQQQALAHTLDQLTRTHPGMFVLVPEIIPQNELTDSVGNIPSRPDLSESRTRAQHKEDIEQYAAMGRVQNEHATKVMTQVFDQDDIAGGVIIVPMHRGLLSGEFEEAKQADQTTKKYDALLSYPDSTVGYSSHVLDLVDSLLIKEASDQLTMTDIEAATKAAYSVLGDGNESQAIRNEQQRRMDEDLFLAKQAKEIMVESDEILESDNPADELNVEIDRAAVRNRIRFEKNMQTKWKEIVQILGGSWEQMIRDNKTPAPEQPDPNKTDLSFGAGATDKKPEQDAKHPTEGIVFEADDLDHDDDLDRDL